MSTDTPRYCTPGTLHPDRLALPIVRALAIETALASALFCMRKHQIPQAAGHAIRASRMLKVACAEHAKPDVVAMVAITQSHETRMKAHDSQRCAYLCPQSCPQSGRDTHQEDQDFLGRDDRRDAHQTCDGE
jgi:hypothetical protein